MLFHIAVSILLMTGQMVQGHILRLPCTTFAQFSIAKENFELYGAETKAFEHLSVNECIQECIFTPWCNSVSTRNSSDVSCKLHSESAANPYDLSMMKKSTGWTYRSTNYQVQNIGAQCQAHKPCPVGTICRDTCVCPGHQCTPESTKIYSSCKGAYSAGNSENKPYSLYLPGLGAFQARCDMFTESRFWVHFQRRVNGNTDFRRGWEEYKKGFGDPSGNYWLGLERLHQLAKPGKGAILIVGVKHSNDMDISYARYSTFEIESEANQYRIRIAGYSGNAGDSLIYEDGMKFSAMDRDNDMSESNCAERYKGGWWHRACHTSNLNGLYADGKVSPLYMSWKSLKSSYGEISFSSMKVIYE